MKKIILNPSFFTKDEVSKQIQVSYKGKLITCKISRMDLILTEDKTDFIISELLEDYAKNEIVVIKYV